MSRQFRSDDTDAWLEGLGDGSDGALTISSNTTEAPIDSSCSGTSGTTSLSATNASFTAGQLILIHQTRGTGVGNWELNKIASYVAGTITTAYALQNTYTDSGASQAQVRVMKQYSAVTINASVTYEPKNWDQNVGGILAFFCNGDVTVNGAISAAGTQGASPSVGVGGNTGMTTGKGFQGGAGYNQNSQCTSACGEGTSGAGGARTTAANGNGGSGNRTANITSRAAGGSGGGNGTAGTNGSTGDGALGGNGGTTAGNAALTNMVFGGGGGGQASFASTSQAVAAGGSGGGIIFIIAKKITVHPTTGSIVATGGTNNSGTRGNISGDGAGGSILLKGQTLSLGTSRVTANGGAGTTGGVGRIHADYSVALSGTTSPTLDSTKDNSFGGGGGGNFLHFLY